MSYEPYDAGDARPEPMAPSRRRRLLVGFAVLDVVIVAVVLVLVLR